MRGVALVGSFVLLAACSGLKHADATGVGPVGETGSLGDGGTEAADAAAGPTRPDASDAPPGTQITVEAMIDGRSRLGARSPESFRPWRTGIAVHADHVYWVESGTTPGLYKSLTSCTGAGCVEQVASMTRPSAFTADATSMLVADTTQLKRFSFAGGAPQDVASAASDIVNLASDGTNAFWTSGTDSAIQQTKPAGTTDAIIYSNGTPVRMAVAGSQVFWAGVDMSGLTGYLQAIGTDGTGAHVVSPFSQGLHAMGGNATYLYYATGSPVEIHRLIVSTGNDDTVDTGALGVTDFALDDTYAYWVEPGDAPGFANGRLRRIAHASNTAETLAVSIALPLAVAVSGRTAFVASAGTKASSYADGKILRVTITE